MATDVISNFGPHLWQNAEMRTQAINERIVFLAEKREAAMNYVAKGVFMGWYPSEMESAWRDLNTIQDEIDKAKRFEEIF